MIDRSDDHDGLIADLEAAFHSPDSNGVNDAPEVTGSLELLDYIDELNDMIESLLPYGESRAAFLATSTPAPETGNRISIVRDALLTPEQLAAVRTDGVNALHGATVPLGRLDLNMIDRNGGTLAGVWIVPGERPMWAELASPFSEFPVPNIDEDGMGFFEVGQALSRVSTNGAEPDIEAIQTAVDATQDIIASPQSALIEITEVPQSDIRGLGFQVYNAAVLHDPGCLDRTDWQRQFVVSDYENATRYFWNLDYNGRAELSAERIDRVGKDRLLGDQGLDVDPVLLASLQEAIRSA